MQFKNIWKPWGKKKGGGLEHKFLQSTNRITVFFSLLMAIRVNQNFTEQNAENILINSVVFNSNLQPDLLFHIKPMILKNLYMIPNFYT